MSDGILSKIRRLNWVLNESTTGNISFSDMCRILCEVVEANVYISDNDGTVLGVGYENKEDTSTITDASGKERLSAFHAHRFSAVESTLSNLRGEYALELLGMDYGMAEKYHNIVPAYCGGQRFGTLIAARYDRPFTEEDIAMCEYGAAIAGIELKGYSTLALQKENRLKNSIDVAFENLSFSERDAVTKIISEIEDEAGAIVVSKVAEKYSLTNSLIVNALRKLESAGVIEAKSMGAKGTYIKIVNHNLRAKLKESK